MADIASLQLKIDSTQAKTAQGDLEKLSTSGEKTEKTFASMAVQVAGAAAALGGAIAIVKSSVASANEYQNSLKGLASVARYAGEDIGSTLATAAKLSEDGILSTTEAVTALKNLLAKGFSTDEAVTMIGRFKDAAAFGRQSSLEFGQAVVSATEGIKNENSMLVDNAGVTKNVAKMVEDYAKSIDKSANSLSEAEKRQAIYNGLLQETEAQVGNAALAAQGLTGQQAILSKTIKDTAIVLGTELMPAATAIVKLIGEGFTFVNESAIKPFLFLFNDIGITIGEVAMKAGAFYELMSSPIALLKNPSDTLKKFTEEIRVLGQVADDERIRAAERISGKVEVDIGADSGARRTESIEIDKKAIKEKEKLYDSIEKTIASLNREADIYGYTAGQIKIYDSARAGANERQIEEIIILSQAMDKRKEDAELQEDIARRNLEITKKYTEDIATLNKKSAEESEKAWTTFADQTQRVFGDVLYNGMVGKFQNIEEMFKEMILRMIANAAAAQAMMSLTSGMKGVMPDLLGAFTGGGQNYGSAGISESSWLSGKRADGGPVSGGSSYLVGERGPEIFTPSSSGNITANGAGGVNITDNTVINIDSRSDRMQVMKDVQKMIENGHSRLVDNLQRKGQLA